MKRRNLLLVCILLLMVLTLACVDTGGDGDNATATPVPPAAREGMSALNALSAEGVQPDCSAYPVWMECQ